MEWGFLFRCLPTSFLGTLTLRCTFLVLIRPNLLTEFLTRRLPLLRPHTPVTPSLYNNPAVAHLVDELYIELHFHYPQLSWWHLHSNWEALDAIRYLRSKGVVVHAWP